LKKLTTDEFVRRSIAVHGSKYSYDHVLYKEANSKVLITCPKHGDFSQRASTHLTGQGCPKCAGVALRTQEDFLVEARKIHSDYYDYSESIYTRGFDKIKIICFKHGPFWQTAYNHLIGQGCPTCKRERLSWNVDDLIQRMNYIHNKKYNYSKVLYKGVDKKIEIVCSKHGSFWQTVDAHLRGCGCPRCVSHVSKWEAKLLDYVKETYPDARSLRNWWPGHPRKEIDIFIPALNIGFECDGFYWHEVLRQDTFKEKEQIAKNQGIKLYQLKEKTPEVENKFIIDSILKNIDNRGIKCSTD